MGKLADWVIEEMERRPVDVGEPFGRTDLHHAILSKRNVMGMPLEERAKIDVPWNLLKVQHEVHLDKPIPEGRDAAELLYKIYGRGAVLVWFDSICWKGKPPFRLP